MKFDDGKGYRKKYVQNTAKEVITVLMNRDSRLSYQRGKIFLVENETEIGVCLDDFNAEFDKTQDSTIFGQTYYGIQAIKKELQDIRSILEPQNEFSEWYKGLFKDLQMDKSKAIGLLGDMKKMLEVRNQFTSERIREQSEFSTAIYVSAFNYVIDYLENH